VFVDEVHNLVLMVKVVLGKTASKKEVDKVEIRRSNKPKLTFTQIMKKQAHS
jgi:hypothetical protein